MTTTKAPIQLADIVWDKCTVSAMAGSRTNGAKRVNYSVYEWRRSITDAKFGVREDIEEVAKKRLRDYCKAHGLTIVGDVSVKWTVERRQPDANA